MKEKENNQPNGLQMPPAWCGAICRNAMNEACIEQCAAKRDCSAFEPKPNLKLEEMPRFPREQLSSMTREEKFTTVTIYLSKIIDHLQGVDDEYPIPIRRGDLYRSGNRTLPQDIKIQDLLFSREEGNCTL